MKIFLSLMLFAAFAFGGHIQWQSSYDSALAKAKEQNKDILLLLLKKDSPRCKTVFVDIFNKKRVQDEINEKYVAAIAFYEDENSYPIEMFYTQQFPALFFVSGKDETFLTPSLSGHFTKKELLEKLKRE
ncbi:thioredoxin family protein [Sulfurimonas sp. HSL-1716]|uniref:thioredoxin family protein n=1 Tax=Hydrocurvibacter sulfurireducens TaxID=3131937 RepID=UPI0031F9324E